MNLTTRTSCAALLLLSTSPLTFAADLDGSWHCADDFSAGPMRINSELTQHFDSRSNQTTADGTVEIYEQGQLSYQFTIKINGTYSVSGQQLTETANDVDIQLGNQPKDPQRAQAMRTEMEQAFKKAAPSEILLLDNQLLQVKDTATGAISSCTRISSEV